jgi:hypothetical protein
MHSFRNILLLFTQGHRWTLKEVFGGRIIFSSGQHTPLTSASVAFICREPQSKKYTDQTLTQLKSGGKYLKGRFVTHKKIYVCEYKLFTEVTGLRRTSASICSNC